MNTIIRWENPPEQALKRRPWTTRTSKLSTVAEELRDRPGDWACVYEGPSKGAATGMATHIRLGQVRAFTPTGDFDAVAATEHTDDGSVHRAWARYVGDDSEEEVSGR